MNRSIALTTLLLVGCGSAVGSIEDLNGCEDGTCLGSREEAIRKVDPEDPGAPADPPPPPTRPVRPPPLVVDLQLTGKAFAATPANLYLEVTNFGTGNLTKYLDLGTIAIDGVPFHAEIPKPIPAGETGVIYVDLTYQPKTDECRTYTIQIDVTQVWQREATLGVINDDPATYENDTRVVHTQCPLGWKTTIIPERLGIYNIPSHIDPNSALSDNPTLSDGYTGLGPAVPEPSIAYKALGTTLGAIVSSQVIVRDDNKRCSQCHYRETQEGGFYRPNVDQGSTQIIGEFDDVGGYNWSDANSLPYFFVHALDKDVNYQAYEKSAPLRWLIQRYADRNRWLLDLTHDID